MQLVSGASGMGKTALMRACLDELADDAAAIVLEGRCYEREAVPYKTLDGVVDELAAHLVERGQRPDGLTTRDLAALQRVFPVLRRVPCLAVPTLPGAVPSDPAELRRRALGALRRIFAGLARTGPLVLAIDDLQWGDTDGTTALAELCEGDGDDDAAPRMLVLATHRAEDASTSDALAVLRARVPSRLRELTLGGLDAAEAHALWSQLAGADAAGAAGDAAVRDAEGSPLLLGEIVQARAAGAGRVDSVDAAVHARLAHLDADAQALLDVVAVATRPLRLALAPRAAGIVDADAAVRVLRAQRLVRVHGADPIVEPRHDRIRAAVVSVLPAARRRAIHASLAATLAADSRDDVDLPELIEHWLGAGEGAQAGALAERAAGSAEDRLAFHRAAELLALALRRTELDGDRRRALLTRRGHALASVGRLSEAAIELRGAVALATGRERRELERLAVENLLRAGQLDRGLEAAGALLRELGERLPRRPLLAAVTERTRLRLRGLRFTARAEADVPAAVLERLDVLWSVWSGLSFADPVRGVALQARLLRYALDAGEPRRLAMALGAELGYVAIAGAAAPPRLAAVQALGVELAHELGQDDVRGFIDAGSGAGAYLAGRFREGVTTLDAGLARLRDHPASMRWQIDLCDILRVAALWWLGELRALRRAHTDGLRAADDGGSVNARRHLCSWPGSVVWLIEDRPDESRAQIERSTVAAADQAGERFHLHHYHALAGRAYADLYEGRADEAHHRLEAAWRQVERAGVLRVQLVEIEARYLRGAAAVAATGAAGAPLALMQLERIERHGVPHGAALASALGAAVALARGRGDPAIAALSVALREAERSEAAALASAIRRRLGVLRGGEHGAAMIGAADAWLRKQGVVAPAAFAAMMVPLPPAA